MTTTQDSTRTGYAAIDEAERTGRTLSKYTDPTEEAREGLSIDEAREIAREDPSLIYLPAQVIHCECGEATGVRCEWTGPRAETVVIEWMPEHLRASHEAAGNEGSYPHNGALRLRVHPECAARLASDESEED